MASPLEARPPGARPDSPSSKIASDPAALMSVFSMFPQHEREPEPEPQPEPAPVLSPAEAAIRALIVPIDTPTPSPPPPRNRDRMQFGTVSTWQKQISPIEAPSPPAPMRVAASVESVAITQPPASPGPHPAEPELPKPELPKPEPREPAPFVASTTYKPASPRPAFIAPFPAPKLQPTPTPARLVPETPIPAPSIAERAPGPEPQPETPPPPPEPKLPFLPQAASWPEPEPPVDPERHDGPSPDTAALFASYPHAQAARLANEGTSLLRRPLLWQITTGICLASAIAAIALSGKAPSANPLSIAAIGVVNAPAPLYLAESDSAGTLRLTALATIAVPNGRDLQLWLIPPGEQNPVSLGVLPSRGTVFTLPKPPTEGTRFVISMEPRGGSTTGRITGQVLYGGTLANR